MIYHLTIPGRLPCLNDIIEAGRSNRYQGAHQKKKVEGDIVWLIRSQLPGVRITRQVNLSHWWYEPNQRRDKDNIISAKKFIWDALVRAGTLKNDGWKEIGDIRDYVLVDQLNPRIVVEIEEIG
jgi:Holliday junction resolvase RusA-like endonuclease